jgi:hypothetical protein
VLEYACEQRENYSTNSVQTQLFHASYLLQEQAALLNVKKCIIPGVTRAIRLRTNVCKAFAAESKSPQAGERRNQK